MLTGHLVYIGDHKDVYLEAFKDEIESFSKSQSLEVKLWEDYDIRELLKSNFSSKVLEAYDRVAPFALKADLARFCILYELGGTYSDIGINFTKKINTDGYDLIVFKDHVIEKMYGIPFAIQISVMFSMPKNPVIFKTINRLVDIYESREYGDNPMFPGGEIHMAQAILGSDNSRIQIGNFGNPSIDIDSFLAGNVKVKYDLDESVAMYKDVVKNKSLKEIASYKTDYIDAWFSGKLYNS